MATDPIPAPSPIAVERLAKLDALFQRRGRTRRWLVLTHDNPDPDALATAWLLRQLLRQRYGASATIGYGGIIGRAENREMVRGLKMKISHIRHLRWNSYGHFALVDTQPRTGNNQLPDDVVPDIVIDHHPMRKETAASAFTDIRPEYGATASMGLEYMIAAGLEIGRPTATAFVYAVRTETRDFSREGLPGEKLLYDWVYPRADKRLLGRIQHPNLPLGYFRTLHHALEKVEGVENVLVCHLENTPTPDDVPQIADLLIRLEGKTWCLATGPYEGRIYLALRTTNPRADAGHAMRSILGRKGKGGGHGMMAGGWFPRPEDGSTEVVQRQLAARLLRQLKKDPAKLSSLALR